MTTTIRGAEDDSQSRGRAPGRVPASSATAPDGGGSVLGPALAPDQCAQCGADLAPDQRYCIECGTRRGKPRFAMQPAAGGSRTPPPAAPAAKRSEGWNASIALLSVVALLLLAVGVGVLIGHQQSGGGKGQDIHVNVAGSAGAADAAGLETTAAPASASSTASTQGSHGSHKSSTAKSGATGSTAAKKVAPAASSGVSESAVKAPTIKPGGACTSGTAGCQGGKETQNFFGN